MSHSPNIQQTRTTGPGIEWGQTHAYIHDQGSMLMILLATHSDQLTFPTRHGRVKLMSTQSYVTRDDNDANNERIRQFLLLISFTCLNHKWRIPGFLFYVFLFFQLPVTTRRQRTIPTYGSPLLPVIPALRTELASIYVRISFSHSRAGLFRKH